MDNPLQPKYTFLYILKRVLFNWNNNSLLTTVLNYFGIVVAPLITLFVNIKVIPTPDMINSIISVISLLVFIITFTLAVANVIGEDTKFKTALLLLDDMESGGDTFNKDYSSETITNNITPRTLAFLIWLKNSVFPILENETVFKQYIPHEFMYIMCELHKSWELTPELFKQGSTYRKSWEDFQKLVKTNKYQIFLNNVDIIWSELLAHSIVQTNGVEGGDMVWRDKNGSGYRYVLSPIGQSFIKLLKLNSVR